MQASCGAACHAHTENQSKERRFVDVKYFLKNDLIFLRSLEIINFGLHENVSYKDVLFPVRGNTMRVIVKQWEQRSPVLLLEHAWWRKPWSSCYLVFRHSWGVRRVLLPRLPHHTPQPGPRHHHGGNWFGNSGCQAGHWEADWTVGIINTKCSIICKLHDLPFKRYDNHVLPARDEQQTRVNTSPQLFGFQSDVSSKFITTNILEVDVYFLMPV